MSLRFFGGFGGGGDKRKSKREERKLEGVSYSLTDKFGDGLVVRASASVEAVGVDGTRTSDQRPQRRCWNSQTQVFRFTHIQTKHES